MNKIAFANILMFAITSQLLDPQAAQSQETSARAYCERGKRELSGATEACRVAWDFTSSPRAYYWIHRFKLDAEAQGQWEVVDGPMTNVIGASEAAPEGGYLYGVVACRDKSMLEDCVYSTVFWAPLLPANVDDIPDSIDTPEGTYERAVNLPADQQVIVYNHALLRRVVSSVDMSAMPNMTQLSFDDLHKLPGGISLADATIDLNLYRAYRTAPLGD